MFKNKGGRIIFNSFLYFTTYSCMLFLIVLFYISYTFGAITDLMLTAFSSQSLGLQRKQVLVAFWLKFVVNIINNLINIHIIYKSILQARTNTYYLYIIYLYK